MNDSISKYIEQYIKRVSLGNYVPCEICGKWHDDGGIIPFKGKEVYACLDCIDNANDTEVDQCQ